MSDLYARQSDLDKLTAQVEKFVENLNKLLVTKEIHEIEQGVLSAKLDKIESMLEETIKSTASRISLLEKREEARQTLKSIIKRSGYWILGAVTTLSTMHFTGLLKLLIKFLFS